MASSRYMLEIYVLFFIFYVSFAQLPRLSSPPSTGLVSSDGAIVQWNAWDEANDEGTGPVARYLAVARIASSDPNAEFTISVDAGTDLSVKVEPLEYEQNYDIAVVCVDGNGDEGLPSPTITITIPCGNPTELPVLQSFETIDTTSLRLTWTNPPQSSWRCSSLDDLMITYEYKRDDVEDFPVFSDNTKVPVNDGELVITDLEPCTKYNVAAYTYASTSLEFSDGITNIVNGTTEFETVGPVDNTNTIGQTNLDPNFIVSWSAPVGSCVPDNYTISYAVIQRLACPDPVAAGDFNVTTVPGIEVTTYILSNLEYHAMYQINITGVNALGPGELVTIEDDTFDGTPTSSPVPSLQEDMAAPGELHFNWTEVPCEEIRGVFRRYLYELYFQNDRIEFGQNKGVDDRVASFDGLDGCTEYNFRVRITNAEGAGPFSELLKATTPTEAPGVVSSLMASTAEGTPTTLDVSWEPADSSVPCVADNYNIEYKLTVLDRCEESNSSLVVLPPIDMAEQSFSIDGLEPYSEYIVSVYASNSGGNSSRVEKVAFTGELAPTGTPMDIIAVEVEYDSLAFSFNELPCGTRRGEITTYNYELRKTGTGEIINGTVTDRYVYVDGLERFTEYGIKISAENSAGSGGFSEEILQYTDEGFPTEPLNLGTYDNPSAEMPLSWQPPAKPNGVISSYEIHYWENVADAEPTSIDFPVEDGVLLRVLITDVEPLKEYTFRIRATNEAGEGDWSSNFTQEIAEGAPSPVVDLKVTEETVDSLTVEWSEPLEPKGVVSQYTVEYVVSDRPYFAEDGDEGEDTMTKGVKPPATMLKITGLEPATEYMITVIAETSSEKGEPSMVKSFTSVPEDIPDPEGAILVSSVVMDDGTLVVKLPPSSYKYATSYQIGVHCADDDSEPTFFNFNNATKCSYIAGEVPASEEEQEFVVGDGKEYGDFKNAPLMKGKEYDIYISIVTRTDKESRVNWSAEPLEAEPQRSAGLIILWIFIILLLIIIILLVLWCAYNYWKKKEEEKKPPSTAEENVPLE